MRFKIGEGWTACGRGGGFVATLELAQGQILSQSPTDATCSR